MNSTEKSSEKEKQHGSNRTGEGKYQKARERSTPDHSIHHRWYEKKGYALKQVKSRGFGKGSQEQTRKSQQARTPKFSPFLITSVPPAARIQANPGRSTQWADGEDGEEQLCGGERFDFGGRTGSNRGRRARGKGEEIGKGEAADFVWLYYRSHVLSPSPAEQYREIGVNK
jgi:hypothetical protein